MYPNFLYIGTAKAGSSWIYEILREHPEVFVPTAKDVQFFDRHYEKGIDWYCSLFKPGMGKKAVGELSHNYCLYEEVAVRIQRHLPDVRLFCCLREPLEKTVSAFLQQRGRKVSATLTFEEYAFRPQTLKQGDYYYNLLPFYERFPRENILVLFFDDLQKDPVIFAKRIYEFLGVDVTFQPQTLYRKVNPAGEARYLWLLYLAYKTGQFLRELGLVNVVGVVKRNTAFRRLLFRPKEKPEIPDEVRRKLKEHYRERNKDLPKLIGQPLPEGWFS